jgi:hypothetical protein
MLREALRRMGRADLIGPGKQQLIPAWQPVGTGTEHEGKRKAVARKTQPFRTQHTGLKGVQTPQKRAKKR